MGVFAPSRPGQATPQVECRSGAQRKRPPQALHNPAVPGMVRSAGLSRWIPALLPLHFAPLQSAGMRPTPSLPRS